MDYSHRLSISYYKTIATINESHKIYLVQHQENKKFFVKKILDVYSIDVYRYLKDYPVKGIPRIIDYCEEDNTLILIEEFISGTTLREKIETQALTKNLIGKYMIGICDILQNLHSHTPPLIHRDIKPSNIMISDFDNVILLDFNAAKYQSGQENRESDTVLLGTQGYAAPEQYGFGESSPQTDIYSVGIVLKEAVLSSIPNDKTFDPIIDKCTQMDPGKRFHSVKELKRAINRAIGGEKIPDESDEPVYKFLPPGFRTLKIWKMIIALPVYALITYITIGMKVEGSYSSGSIWTARLYLFLGFIINILIICNYMDIQSHFAPCRSRNLLIKLLGIIGLMIAATLSLTILVILIEGIVFQFK